MNLFTESGVPVMLKAWSGATEKAPQHGETKVVKVTFKIPLTSERASAFVPGDGELKSVVFKAAAAGDLRPFLRESQFQIKLGSQKLTIQSTPDSPVAIAFDAVKFKKTVTVKQDTEAALILKATIGPCGPAEYAFLGGWQDTQRFVTFDESEPALPMEDDGLTDADEKARVVTNDGPIPPPPMWDDAEEQQAAAEAKSVKTVEKGHRYPKRGKKKGSRRTAADAPAVDDTDDEQPTVAH